MPVIISFVSYSANSCHKCTETTLGIITTRRKWVLRTEPSKLFAGTDRNSRQDARFADSFLQMI